MLLFLFPNFYFKIRIVFCCLTHIDQKICANYHGFPFDTIKRGFVSKIRELEPLKDGASLFSIWTVLSFSQVVLCEIVIVFGNWVI